MEVFCEFLAVTRPKGGKVEGMLLAFRRFETPAIPILDALQV